jgi:hypothetical protein
VNEMLFTNVKRWHAKDLSSKLGQWWSEPRKPSTYRRAETCVGLISWSRGFHLKNNLKS